LYYLYALINRIIDMVNGNKPGPVWTPENIPVQSGRIVIITGANSGIGFGASRILVQKGATVIMACRNLEKSKPALELLNNGNYPGKAVLLKLDLSDFSSIRSFSEDIRNNFPGIDILINNAGIMATPYIKTVDGFEMQFGTNHLGHFLLTGLLLDHITPVEGSRIVTVTSIAHFNGEINFADINSEKSYGRMVAYRQSKLANLLFAYELQRRLSQSGKKTYSVAVHPGISSTGIVKLPPLIEKLKDVVLMSPVKGALPTIMGATDHSLAGGEYIGPDGFRQSFGYPAILESSRMSHSHDLSERLWTLSEKLTGFSYIF
jgi:NAD(P)-dependent dehydrogenase (short-subunit alcohol dehydrogenase family)